MSFTIQSVSEKKEGRVRHATDTTLYDSHHRIVTAIDGDTDKVYTVEVPAHNLTAGRSAEWAPAEFVSYLTDNKTYLLARATELLRQDTNFLSSFDLSDHIIKAVALAALYYINHLGVTYHSEATITQSAFLAKVKENL